MVKTPIEILNSYASFFERKITGRYVTLKHIFPLLNQYQNQFEISEIGTSELGVSIPMLKIGNGPKKVLAWSQMHGNESTTTKAVFDFLKLIADKNILKDEVADFLSSFSFYFIPILNPDGAKLYTRENINGVDLNRDAQNRSQKEIKALFKVFDEVKPDLCLNLHDQRTIYGLKNGSPATVSFLAPAADPKRKKTTARKVAMEHIEQMTTDLQYVIPGHVGRYDDSFSANCVGDSFQMLEVPTILFEAGHYQKDYDRDEVRKYICLSLLSLFGFVAKSLEKSSRYRLIPENLKNFNDILLRDVSIGTRGKEVSIAIQFKEVLKDRKIRFEPLIEDIGQLKKIHGHLEINAEGAEILINSKENYAVGEKASEIINKSTKKPLYIHKNSFR